MATGEQQIAKGTVWQILSGAAGSIILQNKSNQNTAQYYIGTAAPTTQNGVDLRPMGAHIPNIKASETIYARCLKGTIVLAWSE